ncbi:MAG: hypothetical protein F6K19_32555 [Cyanothece sp. SIO1E1]|nr:hypothetical protein [Cyanothece sp. SIO1E1]
MSARSLATRTTLECSQLSAHRQNPELNGTNLLIGIITVVVLSLFGTQLYKLKVALSIDVIPGNTLPDQQIEQVLGVFNL